MKTQEDGPTIQSERVTMRSLTRADEDFYCSLYEDAQVMRHVSAPLTRAEALDGFRKCLDGMSKPEFERRILVLVDRASQAPIGISSIRLLRGKLGHAEVGTLLKPEAHEKGFALECSKALTTQAFTRPQVQTLVAQSSDGNASVERLLTELGFTRTGTTPGRNGQPAKSTWTLDRDTWTKRSGAAKSN
jgi:RimJ/RimL family protein N-acetyltransferase